MLSATRAAAAAALAVATCLAIVPGAGGETRYTVQQLLPADPAGSTEATGVNDAGVAAGTSYFPVATAVRWDAAGQPMPLGRAGGVATNPNGERGSAINNAGVVVGTTATDPTLTSFERGARWEAGSATPTVLDGLGGPFNAALGVNSAGTAVGFSDARGPNPGDQSLRAVRWDAGGTALTRLGSAGPGFGTAIARGVNDAGVAVGTSYKSVSTQFLGTRAVRWTPDGVAHVLGDFGTTDDGRANADAFAINAGGTIVGEAGVGIGSAAAAIWDAGSDTPRILSGGSAAYDINDAGFAVGTSGGSAGRALIWDPDGGVTDLNTLVDPDGNWGFRSARGISNTGYIVVNSNYSSYLLTPVPEPAAGLLLTAAAPFLLGRRRGRA